MKTDEPRLRLELFGGPRLSGTLGERLLSPFQMALVTLVYAEGSISRSKVARIMWGREADSRTRQSIRQLRLGVRQRAGESIVDTKGDMLMPLSSVDCDLQEHLGKAEAGHLLDAATYLRGGFASAEVTGMNEGFHDWRDSFAANLTRRLTTRANIKWESCSRAQDWPGARDAAEAMYLLEPREPEVAARVIEVRARVGRIHSAEVAFAEYREATKDPDRDDPRVEEVIQRVRQIQDEGGHQALPAAVPFVGRVDALAKLSAVISDVRSGTFAFALITGEAGIGKSRLLSEFRRGAQVEGFRCLHARPVELESRISLNPIIDCLRNVDLKPHLNALGEPWRSVIGTMLPPESLDRPVRKLPPIEELSLSRRLLDAFSLLLERLAMEQPTVLFLDDLQWADETTIATLQFLQRRWNKSPFGVIATIRPDLVERGTPVGRYLDQNGKLDLQRIELGDLAEDEALQLIALLGDGAIDDTAADRLLALAGPHPLYLTELARDYLADRLRLPELPEGAINIPVSLKQILASRTAGLPPEAITVARLLAVGARAMRLTDVALVCAMSLDETADAADALKRARLIELDRDRMWIAHDLFRSALYNGMTEPRRAMLHRRLAEHLQAERPDESAGELSIHYDRAGEAELAAEHGWTAAKRALDSGAVAEAAHFYDLVVRNESDERRRADAAAQLATALHMNRDIKRANPALELASARLRAVGMLERARRMDIRRVEGIVEAGDTPVREVIERLGTIKQEARDAEDWEAVALALDVELQLLQLGEDFDGVRNLEQEFLEVTEAGSRSAKAIAHLGMAVGILPDDPTMAVQLAREAVRLTDAISVDRRLKALNRLLIVFYHQGLLHRPENQALISEAQTLAEGSGDLLQRFSFESNMGAAAMDGGEPDRAEAQFAKARRLLGSADMTFPRINLACNAGELALERGDFEDAATAFEEAGTYLGLAIPKYTSDFVNAGLGLCALETGSLAEARRREAAIAEPPRVWYYDPTVIVTFRARLLERRGRREDAVGLLAQTARDLEGRLVMAWIKVRSLEVRLMLKAGLSGVQPLAAEALAVSQRLSLDQRAKEFSQLLSRANGQ